jgi:hypothetical protein
MQTHNKLEIPLNKKKITLMFIGSFVFVALGIWFTMAPDTFSEGPLRTPIVVMVVGIAGIIVFGLFTFYTARKLTDNKPGVIIDDTGITDNASVVAAGHILWADIDNLSVITVQKQSFVLLHVHNPQQYIDRQKGVIKRKLMQMNFKHYGAPITLTANGLAIAFNELYQIIEERRISAK